MITTLEVSGRAKEQHHALEAIGRELHGLTGTAEALRRLVAARAREARAPKHERPAGESAGRSVS
jgi:hypothetical protein